MPTARRPVNTTVVLLIACAAQFMVILDVSIVNVALPSIRTALDFSESSLQWVVSAYTVTFAGFLMLGGRAGDLLGRKRMFLIGVGVFSLASLLGALAATSAQLVAARGLQGLGGAIVAPATLSIITTTFAEGPARNRALGIWGAVAAGGGSAGALFGGILTDTLSWRWILLVNVPIGLVLIPVAWRFIAESRGSLGHRHFDVAGAVSLTAGLVALVLGIVSIGQYGWGSAEVIGGIGAAIVLLALFVTIEQRWASAPLVPLSIFSSRTLTGANVVVGLMGATMFAMWFFLSLYLQQVLGLTPLQAGLAFLPMTGTLAIAATLAPRLVARFGGRATLTTGMLLIALGALLLTRISPSGSWAGDVLVPSVITALGMGLSFVPVTIAAVAGVPPERAGLASGLVNTSRQMGGALGLAVAASLATSLTIGYVHRHGVSPLSGAALVHGYQGGFLLGGLLALAGAAAAALLLPSLRPAPAGAVASAPADA